MSQRKKRNDEPFDSYLYSTLKNKWSEWHVVMRPDMPKNGGYKKRKSEKGGLPGFSACKSLMDGWFDDYDDGIYEWMTAGPRGGYRTVVYVGMTTSADEFSLKERLLDYTRWQSHERININAALKKGLLLHARILPCDKTKQTAECLEYKCLKKFEYAWNDKIPEKPENCK